MSAPQDPLSEGQGSGVQGVVPAEAPWRGIGRTLAGLVILWLCLVLMFKAHTLSDASLVVESKGAGAMETEAGVPSPFKSENQLMLPITMSFGGTSPSEALGLIAKKLGLQLRLNGVETRLDRRSGMIHLENLSLSRAIHQLLGDPGLGVGLTPGTLWIFPQKLEMEENGKQAASLHWSAELPIPAIDAMLISPSGSSDLILTLYRVGTSIHDSNPKQRIGVVIWNGPDLKAMTQVTLNDAGWGRIDLNTAEGRLDLQIRRLSSAVSGAPGRYRLTLDARKALP